jgi:hypothetical protein
VFVTASASNTGSILAAVRIQGGDRTLHEVLAPGQEHVVSGHFPLPAGESLFLGFNVTRPFAPWCRSARPAVSRSAAARATAESAGG